MEIAETEFCFKWAYWCIQI